MMDNDHAGVMTVFFFVFQEKYFIYNDNVKRRTKVTCIVEHHPNKWTDSLAKEPTEKAAF